MMESSSLEEENIKDVENRFRLEKEIKVLKYRIFTNIRNLFEHEEEENYYKPEKVGNFCSNKYIEYESKGDTKKTLSAEECTFFYKKNFYKKISLKNPKTLRKC